MKILKIFDGIGTDLNKCYFVNIPEDYNMDYHYYAMKAIQKMTNSFICGTQIYNEKFDGKIPENKTIYNFFEIHKQYN